MSELFEPFPIHTPVIPRKGKCIRVRKNKVTVFEERFVPAVLYGRFQEMKKKYGGTNYTIFEHWVDFAPVYGMLTPEQWVMICDEAVNVGKRPNELIAGLLRGYCRSLENQTKDGENGENGESEENTDGKI